MEQQGSCMKARLVACKSEGGYTVYVFQNLTTYEFVMCTRCPNWHGEEPQMLQEGFVTYKFVEAGKDSYYSRETDLHITYQYTATYFLDFVPITHVLRNGFVTDMSSEQELFKPTPVTVEPINLN